MESSVFVELKFWFLIFVSLVLPVLMYLLQRRKTRATPLYVLIFGLVLVAISGIDVYLLQGLATASQWTPSLMDDDLFSSELSFGLYVFPVLFGGVGINLVSHALLPHLMEAQTPQAEPRSSAQRSWWTRSHPAKTGQGLAVTLSGAASPCVGVVLPFTRHEVLRSKVQALLEPLDAQASSPGIALQELLSPAFMAIHTRFERFEDMFETGGFSVISQEACDRLCGGPWDGFIRATTQFASWEDMLQSACSHWMARKLFAGHKEPAPTGKSHGFAYALGALWPYQSPWQAGAAANARTPIADTTRFVAVTRRAGHE